ncbi:MAG: hypothetical protein HRU19_27125 [Pseudobacteriovorax sp.]|nr:hypothetical protein [Pseudobacteriovorax sp.]
MTGCAATFKKILFTWFLLTTLPLYASVDRNCLRTHLIEAIDINSERLKHYSAATNGRSESISRQLIWSERGLILLSPLIDWTALYWQSSGIPVACDDYIPMAQTPDFQITDHSYDLRTRISLTADSLRARIDDAWEKSDEAAVQVIDEIIETLNSQKHFNCMTRHLLESVARSLTLKPKYISAAQAKDLYSPSFFMDVLIGLQIQGIGFALDLDKAAAPIQAQGIPIICNDVPHIPKPVSGSL